MKTANAKKALEKAGFFVSQDQNLVTATKFGARNIIFFDQDSEVICIGIDSPSYSFAVSSIASAIKSA